MCILYTIYLTVTCSHGAQQQRRRLPVFGIYNWITRALAPTPVNGIWWLYRRPRACVLLVGIILFSKKPVRTKKKQHIASGFGIIASNYTPIGTYNKWLYPIIYNICVYVCIRRKQWQLLRTYQLRSLNTRVDVCEPKDYNIIIITVIVLGDETHILSRTIERFFHTGNSSVLIKLTKCTRFNAAI